jgi:hypothetical protein
MMLPLAVGHPFASRKSASEVGDRHSRREKNEASLRGGPQGEPGWLTFRKLKLFIPQSRKDAEQRLDQMAAAQAEREKALE